MKNKENKRSKASCILLSAIFIGYVAAYTLGTFLIKDRDFSEMENRTLAQKPELTTEKVFSGEFESGFESYMSDQIFVKDAMMSLKTCCDYFSGKTYQNGVYFGKDGYMLQRYTQNTAQVEKNISYINTFADKLGKPVDFILAPNAIDLNADKLPAGAVTDDQDETIALVQSKLSQNVTLFSARDTLADLQKQGVQAYYRTDHHWTSSAARAVCDAWLNTIGYAGTGDEYEYRAVPDFYGTLYSKAPASFVKPDTFGYFANKSAKYTVKYEKENKFAYDITDTSYLTKKDKYASYFGGNFAQLKITSDSAERSKEKILVLKDSYANSMVQYLADKFDEVYMVDLRYSHFDAVSEMVEKYGIDRVLLVYNVDFINEDTNFIWLE
jgi:hypothetical protein